MTSSTLTRKAFVIGVSSFGAGLRPLDRAVDHARDFGELLQGVFHFDTESLFDPTCAEMDAALTRAAASPAAAVVVHVLSHGEWVRVGEWRGNRHAEAGPGMAVARHATYDNPTKGTTMTDERPLMDTVLAMTAASLERANLVDRELMLVRLAALAAVDAPASSYLLNLGAAADVGLTLEDVQGVLVAIAPIVGSPKVVTAAGTNAAAHGLALAIDDALTGEGADDDG